MRLRLPGETKTMAPIPATVTGEHGKRAFMTVVISVLAYEKLPKAILPASAGGLR